MTRTDLHITPDDARAAIAVASRWREYAIAFGERVGENVLEQQIARALAVVTSKGGRCPRRVVAHNLHCYRKVLDDIESTLVDRGMLLVHEEKSISGAN